MLEYANALQAKYDLCDFDALRGRIIHNRLVIGIIDAGTREQMLRTKL